MKAQCKLLSAISFNRVLFLVLLLILTLLPHSGSKYIFPHLSPPPDNKRGKTHLLSQASCAWLAYSLPVSPEASGTRLTTQQ